MRDTAMVISELQTFLNFSSFYLFFNHSDNYIYFIKEKITYRLTEDVRKKKTKQLLKLWGKKESVLRVIIDIFKGEKWLYN